MRIGSRLRAKEGIALLMVMVLITMLTIMSVEVAETGASHYLITTSLRDTVKARALAHSGVNTVGAILKADQDGILPSKISKMEIDYLGEPWNLQPPANELPLGDGRAQAFVEDEMSKINAQEMSGYQFSCLVKSLELEMDVENAYRWLEQWSDRDKNKSARDDPYSMRVPPILRSDAFLETVSELGLVQGIGWDNLEKLRPFLTVYPRSTPPPQTPQAQTNQPAVEPPKNSKVNVNTAKKEVLACLSPEFERAAEEIVRRREEKPFESLDPTNFTGIFQGPPPILGQFLTVKSDVFSVTSIGRVGPEGRETTVVVNAVINRAKSAGRSEVEYLYWREQ